MNRRRRYKAKHRRLVAKLYQQITCHADSFNTRWLKILKLRRITNADSSN